MNDIAQLLLSHGGPVLFAVVFAEQAGVPLPSAPWLLAAGALSAGGRLNPALTIALTAIAAVMADSLWFYVGRRRGHRVLRLFCWMSLERNSCVGRTRGVFARHGLQALVAAKFLPGLGAVMPPLAGALGMGTGRFLLFDGIGSLLYASFYILAGYVFHDQLQGALAVLSRLGFSIVLVALVVAAGYIAYKYARRRNNLSRERRHRPAEAPEADASVDLPSGLAARLYEGAVVLSAESSSSLQLQNLALAVTGPGPQPIEASAAAHAAATPCQS